MEFFTAPAQVNHRGDEALRAFFVDGLTHAHPCPQTHCAEIRANELGA